MNPYQWENNCHNFSISMGTILSTVGGAQKDNAIVSVEHVRSLLDRLDRGFIVASREGQTLILNERAKKYFAGHHTFPGQREDFARGCAELAQVCGHKPAETVAVLADHLDEVLQE